MNEIIKSASFPKGLPSLRSEEQARAERSLSMLDVIRGAVGVTAKSCPFCGEDPPLAVVRAGRYIVGCETEGCDTQKAGSTLAEAWAKWNRRAP